MLTKAKIDDHIYDIVNFDDYMSNKEKYKSNYTAVIEKDTIYPIRGKNDTRPGLYPDTVICKFINPDETEKEMYDIKNVIDFSNVGNIKEIIEKQNKLKSAENSILTTVDNVFIPKIDENDSPEMVGLKEAIIAKEIDLDKYEQRFGANYNNDKRLLAKNTITMSKLKTMLNALDIKATLILEDKSAEVPNPIGKQIVVDLTSSEVEEEESND